MSKFSRNIPVIQHLIHILGACKKNSRIILYKYRNYKCQSHLLIYNLIKQNNSIQHYINIQAHNTIQQKSPGNYIIIKQNERMMCHIQNW
jgi:hypothetical protein